MEEKKILLKAENIGKEFNRVRVLSDIDFDLRAGEVGADVDVDNVKALGKNFFKKSAELLGAHRRRLGEDALLAVLGVEIRRGVAAVVGENPLPALDGQGHGADSEALQQRRRQVAGAVVCNANGSVHDATPPIIYIITMDSIKGKAQVNL